ncbi:RHS repeat-associated core domain-containing protein [Enterobacter kobei]|uniref:RHS repeat protein n=1 Tax=Enterobacter kobei TaxID=208224 RepID=UPI003CEDFE8A
MSTSLFSKTPTVTVLDNRGLTVRNIAYLRYPGSSEEPDERITRHQYDARGFLMQSADPRLYDAGLVNFTYLTDLTGSVLRSQGLDNGTTMALNDAASRPFMTVNNIRTADDGTDDLVLAVTRTFQYEGPELPGRLLSVTEQVTDDVARITERFVYAGNADAEKDNNLAGVCISHYDTAGLVQTDSITLTGIPLSVTRRLLTDADNPDAAANWQGADASVWNGLLAMETFTTLTTADATGAVLTTTDAKGNLQRVTYDVAGLLSGSWLTLKGGKEQTIVASLTYSAAGQKLREEHGNGVVTTYTYEAETQRLTGIKTERPAGHAAGTKVLQDLRYEYDPVGNVLKISNDTEETRFWRNQKVEPGNTYVYDSLYQLVSATGREMANAGQQGSNLPATTVPLPTDSSAYTSYTRIYTYDEAGNLTQISHSAPATNNNYTTDITVSDRSNRGVLSSLTKTSSEVDALFTAGGQQKQLQPGQSLVWTARNELLKVTPVVRDGGTDDRESYRYDGSSQRILKVSAQKTGNSTQMQRVLYLAGVELRSKASGDSEMESLQVITAGEAGRAQVRVLHWESGLPEGVDNDQVRYSYDNLTGSSQLELDSDGKVISMEEYYPYGGTAVWTARSQTEADYKTVRYSGKERDTTGLYYYGYRYYQPWAGRWLSADPAGTVDGLNLFRMVRNNPVTMQDIDGLAPDTFPTLKELAKNAAKDIRKYQVRDVLEYMGGINELSGHSYAIAHEKTYDQLIKMNKKKQGDNFSLTISKVSSIISKSASSFKPKNSYDLDVLPTLNADKSGLIGVPVKGKENKFAIPLERDVDDNEILYRTISESHYDILKRENRLSPTTETSVSPALSYSEGYNGVLVRFTLKKGTMQKLVAIGGGVNEPARTELKLGALGPGWAKSRAGFKTEGNQMTVHLGTGEALKIFNENIIAYSKLKIREKNHHNQSPS